MVTSALPDELQSDREANRHAKSPAASIARLQKKWPQTTGFLLSPSGYRAGETRGS